MIKTVSTYDYLELNTKPFVCLKGKSKYPWPNMKVGDSFIIKYPTEHQKRIHRSAFLVSARWYLDHNNKSNIKCAARSIDDTSIQVYLVNKNDPKFAVGSHRIKYPWANLKIGESFDLNFNNKKDLKYMEGIVQNAGKLYYKLHRQYDCKVSIRMLSDTQLKIHLINKDTKLPWSEASMTGKGNKK